MGGSFERAVRRGVATDADPGRAARALADQIADPRAALVIAFASWRYDPDVMAAALADAFAPTPVIGCTSNSEIGGGCHEGAVVGLTLLAPAFRVGVALATDLRRSALRASRTAVVEAAAALGAEAEALDPSRHAAITLVDGRCGVEESFCLGSAASAPQLRFVGGSASDSLTDVVAAVFHGGAAHRDAGVVALLASAVPLAAIQSEHMSPTDERVVVTAADPEQRLVHELNGHPASVYYQRMVRRSSGQAVVLDDVSASSHPFATYIGERPYVRSVVRIEGTSLRFAAAVDAGTVLRLMRPGDLVGSTREALRRAAAEVGGSMAAVLAFSCLGRYREAMNIGNQDSVTGVYDEHAVIGFHSFGEQAGALLVNHTLTGLAIGGGPVEPARGVAGG